MTDFLDCKICHIQYDEEDHQPRHASCGHDICSTCLKVLIKESIFMCPHCKQKHIADVPDDLTINFGLIDVLRAFKIKNISIKETNREEFVAENYEVCKVHNKSIAHRCLTCQIWGCDECIESHSNLVGCSTIGSYSALNDMQMEHTEYVDKLLIYFEEDATYVSSKVQEHTDKKNECLEMAENHRKEAEKFQNMLQQGKNLKNLLEESKKQLNSSNTPYAAMDRIEVLTQRKQAIRNWSIKNLGCDSLICLSKSLEDGKIVYAEIISDKEKIHAKLSAHRESLHIHHFCKQTAEDGCMTMPLERLSSIIPDDPSLVFLELSLEGVVKGRVIFRLSEDLPNIRKNFVEIISGQGQGRKSLNGIKLNYKNSYDIGYKNLPFSDMQVTPDRSDICTAKTGSVIGYFGSGYLQYLYFYIDNPPKTYNYGDASYCVFATVEEGLDILRECHANYGNGVIINTCGMVVERKKKLF